jgi:hypothetical protein
VKGIGSVQLRRRWQIARIQRYVQRHREGSDPALRKKLLARGYDAQLVEQVLAEGPHPPSTWVPFLVGLVVTLAINLWIHVDYRDDWMWALMGEGLALWLFMMSAINPPRQPVWTSKALRGHRPALIRRQERGVGQYIGWGLFAGALASILVFAVW